MPKPPLPPDLVDFLAEPSPSVIASIRPDGSPHTAATWYLWVDGRVLVNMDENRRRLEHLRQEPRVSLTVLGREDWYHHVTLRGHVAELVPDPQFTDIDRLSELRYYRRTLPRDRRRLLERYEYIHAARKVVGVGGVAARAWIVSCRAA